MIALSIKARIVAWFLALAVLLLALFSLSLYFGAYRSAYRALDELLEARARAYASMVEYDQGVFDFEAGESAFFEPRRGETWRGFAIYRAADGEAIFVSPSFSGREPNLSEILADLPPKGAVSFSGSRAFPEGKGMFRLHAGVYSSRQERESADEDSPRQTAGPGVLVVTAEDLGPVRAQLRRLVWRLVPAFAVTLLVAAALGWLLSRRIVAPLSSMADAAARIQASDLGGRVPVRGTGDEIDRLAATLNAAFGRLVAALESQSRFTADAAHEVRTPVAVIRAQAESALRAERGPEEYRQALSRVLESALRLEELVEGLLVLSRADSGGALAPVEGVDLSALARRLLEQREAEAASRSLSLDLHAAGPVMVRGDHRLLAVAAGNLLDNAIRFSEQAGRVAVVVESRGGFAELEVVDQGPGIEQEHLPHIFERFYTANASRSREEGGSGLGLSLVQTVARLHGGTVAVRSAPGQGSSFTLRLPLESA